MSDPLRIGYLTSYYGRVSDTFIRNEVLQLRQLGHHVQTYSIRRPPVEGIGLEAILQEQSRTTYLLEQSPWRLGAALLGQCIRHPSRSWAARRLAQPIRAPGWRQSVRHLAYLAEAAYLANRLHEDRIQHLHNHIGENSATVALLAARLAQIPYSLTIHGPGMFYAPQHWGLGTKIEQSAFTACISHFCRSQCMVFTAPDKWDRLHIVRCSVQEAFLQSVPRAMADPPTWVCIGRLCPEKGQRLLIAAAAKLREDGHSFRIVVVGDGPLKSDLQSEIDRHQLHDYVSLPGWLDSDSVANLLRAARALVVASFAEGLPVVIMEALALGCPVVSTQVAGIPELVVPGQTGWLIPPGSVDHLADALRTVLRTPDSKLEELGRRGAEAVRQYHHPVTETARLAQLIERSITENRFSSNRQEETVR